MNKRIFLSLALVFCLFNSSFVYAQSLEWIFGKWLGAGEVITITGASIRRENCGNITESGALTIYSDSTVFIDGKLSDLIILFERKSIAYQTNPQNPLVKYEDLVLESNNEWIKGVWTDGIDLFELSDKNIEYKHGDSVLNKGIYYVDDSGFLNAYWASSENVESLLINGNSLAIEGGENLYKLPDGANYTNIIASLTESSMPFEGDIQWAYGLWQSPDGMVEVNITPKYFQEYQNSSDSYCEDIKRTDKKEYTLTEESNKILGAVIRLGDYYLDPVSQTVFVWSGVAGKVYLDKTENYASPIWQYVKWGLLGLAGITILVFFIIGCIRLSKGIAKLFNKAKKNVSEKVEKYKQTVAEVDAEALNWKSLDPTLLRCVLDGKTSAATDIYKSSTGSSDFKAGMFIQKIKPIVKAEYPTILINNAMDKIKDVWPYGTDAIVAFSNQENGESLIRFVWMDADIDGKYYFHVDYLNNTDETTYDVTIADGIPVLSDGHNIIEMKAHKLPELNLNFDGNDAEYQKLKTVYQSVALNETIEVYDVDLVMKVLDGDISMASFRAASKPYKISFVGEYGAYVDTISVDGFNIGELSIRYFFDYYLHKYIKFGQNSVNPWESYALFNVLGQSERLLGGYNPSKLLHCLHEEATNRLKEAETEGTVREIPLSMEDLGIRVEKDENGVAELVGDSTWDAALAATEGLRQLFNGISESNSIDVTPYKIIDNMLVFRLNLNAYSFLNEDAKASLLEFEQKSTIGVIKMSGNELIFGFRERKFMSLEKNF